MLKNHRVLRSLILRTVSECNDCRVQKTTNSNSLKKKTKKKKNLKTVNVLLTDRTDFTFRVLIFYFPFPPTISLFYAREIRCESVAEFRSFPRTDCTGLSVGLSRTVIPLCVHSSFVSRGKKKRKKESKTSGTEFGIYNSYTTGRDVSASSRREEKPFRFISY